MEQLLSIAPHIAFWEEQDLTLDEISIYVANLQTSEIFEFKSSAAIIWSIIAEGLNRNEVIREVAKVYGEQENIVATGVDGFIDDLLDQNMLIEIKE